ncbi:Hypothetical_protein [Hexamita inflata]|uniref:Hypothetical_protein n=1 Tax=Hexamita inflata TaxID=28002 RepID=A0AA86NLH9_9EUKA|nr:Hypothetical protein HINF_LOCUS9760 [Hexamita inflata]
MYQQRVKVYSQIPQILSGLTSVRVSQEQQNAETEVETESQFNQMFQMMQKQISTMSQKIAVSPTTIYNKQNSFNPQQYTNIITRLEQNQLILEELENRVTYQDTCCDVSAKNLQKMTEHFNKLKNFFVKKYMLK